MFVGEQILSVVLGKMATTTPSRRFLCEDSVLYIAKTWTASKSWYYYQKGTQLQRFGREMLETKLEGKVAHFNL